VFTATVVLCFALATAWWGHPGLHNLVWFIGVPTVTALVAFKSAESRIGGALGLIVFGFVVWVAAAYFLLDGYY
jgi:hypothetical protein